MPPRKKVDKKGTEALQKNEISSTSLDSSAMSLNTTRATGELHNSRITKRYLEDKLKEKLVEIDDVEARAISDMENLHAQLLIMSTPDQLKTQVSLEKIEELMAIMEGSLWEIVAPPQPKATPASATKRTMLEASRGRLSRRSLSASENRLPIIEEQDSPRPTRSSSVGSRTPYATPLPPSVLQTPMNRFPPSRILMATKYTVRKPLGQSQTHNPMKRIMRAGEEAISTCGSPLFVQGRVPNEPEINIPLQNGVILNIDPNNPDQHLAVPEFDPETLKKIRILCRKLQNCISE